MTLTSKLNAVVSRVVKWIKNAKLFKEENRMFEFPEETACRRNKELVYAHENFMKEVSGMLPLTKNNREQWEPLRDKLLDTIRAIH